MMTVTRTQQPRAGTYLEAFPMLEHLIQLRLHRGDPDGVGETSRIWISILAYTLPPEDGFFTGPEMYQEARTPEFEDPDPFMGHSTLDARFEEDRFFIVESKTPGLELDEDIWASAYNRLGSYLLSIRFNHLERKFGAIAIGKAVRFYEFQENCLIDLEGDGSIYYIDRQCQTVTAKLHFIRDNHHF